MNRVPLARTALVPGLCLLYLLTGCGNKGDLYLPGSEADERSLRTIDQLLDDLEREEDEEDASTSSERANGVQDPAAGTP